eukprot:TRINITY_DN11756_c0_g1_i2.p1 TRINITY_DN11756_c0_g1~~TRINITY_DN11756_c0_g1_i2.p1  ORF type:complete len:721 (+),score=77.23 TRINITY_DN11756_c0_g1_i2:92-2254(+)
MNSLPKTAGLVIPSNYAADSHGGSGSCANPQANQYPGKPSNQLQVQANPSANGYAVQPFNQPNVTQQQHPLQAFSPVTVTSPVSSSSASSGPVAKPSPSQVQTQQLAKTTFSVATEVQHMIERNGFKPLSIQGHVLTSLSHHSQQVLRDNNVTLWDALAMHSQLVSCWEHDGFHMVSEPGSPWLGPGPSAPAAHGPTGPKQGLALLQGIQRGKAVTLMDQLSDSTVLQESLADISRILLSYSYQTALISQIGTAIKPATRNFLRSSKLRTVQLLRCFPDDFLIEDKGAGTTVTYIHDHVKSHYETCHRTEGHDALRHARLLKLAADVTQRYDTLNSISAGSLSNKLRSSSCLVVDVRKKAEQVVGLLPGAISPRCLTSINTDDWDMVVAYCCIGERAAKWLQDLADRGLPGTKLGDPNPKYYYLIGGVAAWAHYGELLIDVMTGQPTKRVHCWTWELAPLFPSISDYKVTWECDQEHGNSMHPTDCLKEASKVRAARLRDLAWEVRLRYCPKVYCFEAEDILQSFRSGEAQRQYIFIDCRTLEERSVSIIAGMGCQVLSADEFKGVCTQYKWSNFVFVVYCTVGGRSGIFCDTILTELDSKGEAGALQMRSLMGGIASWCHAGGGLVDPMGMPTQRVNPWCQAFMDIFPVHGIELVNEVQATPKDAQAFTACLPSHPLEVNGKDARAVSGRIMQTIQALSPETLADSLDLAAQRCPVYED